MRTLLLALAVVLLAPGPAAAGKLDVDLELDAYYSALGVTIPFTDKAVGEGRPQDEFRTYTDLISKAFVPRFMVVEASVNPMPLAGVLLRRHAWSFYSDTEISDTTNLVEAVTAGFEEPWAAALFLGDIVSYDQREAALTRSRKGYVGYLASYGNYHIISNQLIPDHWVEVEAKIKGDLKTEARKMSFSFRGGHKMHGNREILDVYYIAFRRSRVDYKSTRLSWLLSSAIEYKMELSKHDLEPVAHKILVEKNWPLRGGKMTFSLGAGFLWQSRGKYTGDLNHKRRPGESKILLRPNLKF